MNRILYVFVLSSLFLASTSRADEYVDDWRYKIEGSGAYEHATAGYGDWGGANLTLWGRYNQHAVFFLDGAFWYRNDGPQGIGGLGAYIDWTSWLYTFTSVYMGTKSDYNPLVRVDHEFNFKFGPRQMIVATAAFTYIKNHDEHYDLTPQAGISVYIPWWVFTYRFFFNISNPGTVFGPSHLIAVEYGAEGAHWTSLTARFGKAAYLATYLVKPEKIDEWSMEFALSHRHWIGRNWGLFRRLSFMRLFGEYDKCGVMLGAFVQWGRIPLD